jgi:hypothetical protein
VHEFQRISQQFFRAHACTMLTGIIFRYAMPSLMPIYLRRVDGGFKLVRRYRPRAQRADHGRSTAAAQGYFAGVDRGHSQE